MSDLQAIADRVEIEALRGEFADAVMMNDHDRLASLFTHDGVVRIPEGGIEAAGREGIRALGERRQALTDYFVQTTHPGTIQLDGGTATGRAYLSELAGGRDGLVETSCRTPTRARSSSTATPRPAAPTCSSSSASATAARS